MSKNVLLYLSSLMQLALETPRLLLRPLAESDADGMFELDSDPEVHKYLGNKPIKTLQEAKDVISFIHRQYTDNGIGRYAVIEKVSGNFIGWSGLKFMTTIVNGKTHYYDLGYRLIPSYWGKGYATESAIAWRDHAFSSMNIEKLFGTANVENAASNRILQKTGLQFVEQYFYEDLLCNWYELKKEYHQLI